MPSLCEYYDLYNNFTWVGQCLQKTFFKYFRTFRPFFRSTFFAASAAKSRNATSDFRLEATGDEKERNGEMPSTKQVQCYVAALWILIFLQYLALGVTANCICEIHCLAIDGFDLKPVHKLSNIEKKS